MNKMIRISLVSVVLFLLVTVSTNLFAAETARRHYVPATVPVYGNYHGNHNNYHRTPYHHQHVSPPCYDRYHYPQHDYYHNPRPIVIAPPGGIYFRTPHASFGVCF
jgi:hypothetical protein